MQEHEHSEEEISPPNAGSPPDSAAVIPAGEDTLLTDTVTTKPIPAPDMEIHHSQHVHHKKKWNDYLFEFIMLFLAVSAGFLVENLREHYVEHLRAKEYAVMLHKDLASDTVILDIIGGFRTKQAKRYDSLKRILDSIPFDKIDQQQFLGLATESGKYLHLIPNNGTLQQLKSSGSLRYFRDTALIYMLSSYEEDLRHLEYVQAEEKEFAFTEMLPFKMAHLNNRLLKTAMTNVQNFPAEKLVGFDKKGMMIFYNLLERSTFFNDIMGEASLNNHKKKAIHLMEMLKEEYR